MLKQNRFLEKQHSAHHHRANQGVTTPCCAWRFEKIFLSVFGIFLFLTACCAPATTANSTLPDTAFTATFLGYGEDGQSLLARPEKSKEKVQLVYDKAENLVVGQRMYVVGRLEGNLVYVTDLRPL